jgi:hypothetical protein
MTRVEKDISKKLAVALLVLILVLSELLIYHHASQKSGFHVDELWSFAHSNSSNGGFLYPVVRSGSGNDHEDMVYNNWTEPEKFWNYLTVQDSEVFEYSDIINNLSDDVHPPLYYFLLHSVCSFFPETFSKWLGIIPNMVLFSFVLLGLYRLAILLFNSRTKSLLVCSVFSFSLAAVNMTLFIRSYLLLTLISLLLIIEVSKLLLDPQQKTSRLIKIFLLAILGLFTHYYFIIFLVIVTALVGYYYFVKKQNKRLFIFTGIIVFAIGITFLFLPNITTHLFLSLRGFNAGIRALLWLTAFACIMIIALIIYRIIRKKSDKGLPTARDAFLKVNGNLQNKLAQLPTHEFLFILLYLTTILTAVVVILIAPNMGIYTDRYFFNLMPLLCLTVIMLIFSLTNKYRLGEKAAIIFSTMLLLLSFSSNLFIPSAYVFPVSENQDLLNQEIQDSVCLYSTDEDYKIHSFSDVFFTAEKVFATREVTDTSIKSAFSTQDGAQRITVIVDSSIPQSPEELSILTDQIGYPLQFLYEARYGQFFYRIYSLK